MIDRRYLESDSSPITDSGNPPRKSSSMGSFLRADFLKKVSDTEVAADSSAQNSAYESSNRIGFDTLLNVHHDESSSDREVPMEPLQEPISKSRKLVRKAFNTYGASKRAPTPFTSTKQSILRRLSLKSFRPPSMSSTVSSISLNQPSFDSEIINLANDYVESKVSLDERPAPSHVSYVLNPKITVTCEYASVDCDESVGVWAAVLITAELQPVSGDNTTWSNSTTSLTSEDLSEQA